MLAWTKDLATGIGVIDDQHKELFKRVNDLLSAMKQGKGKEQLAGLLGFLADYVVTHFGTEEKFMQAHDYPQSLGHKAEHMSFVRNLSDLRKRFDQEGPGSLLAIESQRLLVDWWYNHIGKSDKALGAFLKGKGV
ncbi:MAG: hemerythrin family protein [Firmicutes bacterium]|nr:hemerythrin family protein [Candidatus Fermentithermobacillaceae bacterium]